MHHGTDGTKSTLEHSKGPSDASYLPPQWYVQDLRAWLRDETMGLEDKARRIIDVGRQLAHAWSQRFLGTAVVYDKLPRGRMANDALICSLLGRTKPLAPEPLDKPTSPKDTWTKLQACLSKDLESQSIQDLLLIATMDIVPRCGRNVQQVKALVALSALCHLVTFDFGRHVTSYFPGDWQTDIRQMAAATSTILGQMAICMIRAAIRRYAFAYMVSSNFIEVHGILPILIEKEALTDSKESMKVGDVVPVPDQTPLTCACGACGEYVMKYQYQDTIVLRWVEQDDWMRGFLKYLMLFERPLPSDLEWPGFYKAFKDGLVMEMQQCIFYTTARTLQVANQGGSTLKPTKKSKKKGPSQKAMLMKLLQTHVQGNPLLQAGLDALSSQRDVLLDEEGVPELLGDIEAAHARFHGSDLSIKETDFPAIQESKSLPHPDSAVIKTESGCIEVTKPLEVPAIRPQFTRWQNLIWSCLLAALQSFRKDASSHVKHLSKLISK